MELDFKSERPIFMQIAAQIEDAVFTGAFAEETQIPSTTDISVAYKINPATVLKGMNLLAEDGILYKKRGLGLFVATGARALVRSKRQQQFFTSYVSSLVAEAKKLGLSKNDVIGLVERGYEE